MIIQRSFPTFPTLLRARVQAELPEFLETPYARTRTRETAKVAA